MRTFRDFRLDTDKLALDSEEVQLRGRLSLDDLLPGAHGLVTNSEMSLLLLLVDRVGSETGPPDWYALAVRPTSAGKAGEASEVFQRIGLLHCNPWKFVDRQKKRRWDDEERGLWEKSLAWMETGPRKIIRLV